MYKYKIGNKEIETTRDISPHARCIYTDLEVYDEITLISEPTEIIQDSIVRIKKEGHKWNRQIKNVSKINAFGSIVIGRTAFTKEELEEVLL